MAENPNIVTLGDQGFKEEVLEAKGAVLVDFWAPWCGPCKMLGPVIEELADDFKGKAKICKLNVDENQKTAGDYGVMSIPTVVIFKDGKEVNRMVGFVPKANIAKVIEQYL
ncbi:MAG: thioredoxin [Clostridia bacterium]|nr:thioredoxin [Clostridia bacterium]